MNKAQHKIIIETLEFYQSRHKMVASDQLPAIVNFLGGFRFACGILTTDFQPYIEVYETVISERGWSTTSPIGPHRIMEQKGLDADAIAHELISIEIEVWTRLSSD